MNGGSDEGQTSGDEMVLGQVVCWGWGDVAGGKRQ